MGRQTLRGESNPDALAHLITDKQELGELMDSPDPVRGGTAGGLALLHSSPAASLSPSPRRPSPTAGAALMPVCAQVSYCLLKIQHRERTVRLDKDMKC